VDHCDFGVVDSRAAAADPKALEHARCRYPGVAFVLVHGAGAVPPGPWAATLQRPVTIGDIVATTEAQPGGPRTQEGKAQMKGLKLG
jgi:hypothetical protein